MADISKGSRRTAAGKPDADEAAAAAGEGNGGEVTPPEAPPAPSDPSIPSAEAQEQARRDQEPQAPNADDESAPMPKDYLIRNAYDLLGYDPVVARGVLEGADEEEISVADAKDRVQRFLSTPVTSESRPEEA